MRARAVGLFFLCLAWVHGAVGCQAEPKLTIATKQDRQLSFKVEVADTPVKREMGLQYRQELADDRGMIFIFPVESQQSFWMKNTPIALDMIFINRDRKIVGIVEQTTPFSLESRSVPAPSQYVLEIRGGLAKRYGIQSGDSVRFDGISTDAVRE
jgi:uncharacterized membrane protein (UPF0127 family)